MHAHRGDATNASVLHGSKLMNLDAVSYYHHGGPDREVYTHHGFADLAVVSNASGAGTRNITAKQLTSLGIPVWTASSEKSFHPINAGHFKTLREYVDGTPECDMNTHVDELRAGCVPVRIYMKCSDRGSDEVKAREFMGSEIANDVITQF